MFLVPQSSAYLITLGEAPRAGQTLVRRRGRLRPNPRRTCRISSSSTSSRAACSASTRLRSARPRGEIARGSRGARAAARCASAACKELAGCARAAPRGTVGPTVGVGAFSTGGTRVERFCSRQKRRTRRTVGAGAVPATDRATERVLRRSRGSKPTATSHLEIRHPNSRRAGRCSRELGI